MSLIKLPWAGNNPKGYGERFEKNLRNHKAGLGGDKAATEWPTAPPCQLTNAGLEILSLSLSLSQCWPMASTITIWLEWLFSYLAFLEQLLIELPYKGITFTYIWIYDWLKFYIATEHVTPWSPNRSELALNLNCFYNQTPIYCTWKHGFFPKTYASKSRPQPLRQAAYSWTKQKPDGSSTVQLYITLLCSCVKERQ